MEGAGDKQLEFEKMLDTAKRGGPEAGEVVKEAKKQELIYACEDAGVEPPSEREVERIVGNMKNLNNKGERTTNGLRDWTHEQEQKEEAAREHLEAIIREQERRKKNGKPTE